MEDGDKYVGEHKDGKYQGQGTYTWKDGGKYVGEFKDGEYDGQGTHTWSDRFKYVGSWKGGQMWNGIYYDNNGNIFGKYVNGVEQ